MTVYVDLLFVLNLVINTLVLAGGSVLARERVHRVRLLAAAALGALYSVMVFFPRLGFWLRVGMRLPVSALMVAVGIPTPTLKRYLRALLFFYVSLAVFGGGMYLFYSFTSAGAQMIRSNGVYYVDMPLWLLLTVSFLFYGLIRLGALWQSRRPRTGGVRQIEICCNGRYRALTAFVDTGHTLTDPLTLSPVIIVEAAALTGVLPTQLIDAVKAGRQTDPKALSHNGLTCRLIPFHGVGEQGGLLLSVRPDWVRFLPDGAPVEQVLLGLCARKMSDDYQALLPQMMEE